MANSEQARREHAQDLLKKYRAGEMSASGYSSMIVLWGKTHLLEARPEIEPFLRSADATLRGNALHALGLYFQLEEYWPIAVQLFLYDADYQVRKEGASVLGWLKRDTRDQRTLEILASTVRDTYESEQVRERAYRVMRKVFHQDREEELRLASEIYELEEWEELGDIADWRFVNTYLNPLWEQEQRAEAYIVLEEYRAKKIAEQDYGSMLLRFGKTRLMEAQMEVEAFLKSADVQLRILALHVLVLYFHVLKNWQLAVDVLEHDQHTYVRQAAANVLGLLMRKTRDKKTLRVLDKAMWGEDQALGGEAHEAMKKVFNGEYAEIEAFLKTPDDPNE